MPVSDRALLTALYTLSPRDFESMVAQLLEATGYYEVRVQGGADDRGVDIICRDAEGRRVAVQCKRYAPTSTVSALTVQHLAGMAVKSRAARAMLVTTGGFTAPALAQARDFDIELIDGLRLASMIAAPPSLVAALSAGPVQPIAEPDQPTVFVPPAQIGREHPDEGCGLLFWTVCWLLPAIAFTVAAANAIPRGEDVGFLLLGALVSWFLTLVVWRL